MILINILEKQDIIFPSDWCRPLRLVSMSGGMSDGYSFKSMYTGTPENNVKWVKVKHVIGKCWHGKTVEEFHKAMSEFTKYEFLRGDLPKPHCLDMSNYSKLTDSKLR